VKREDWQPETAPEQPKMHKAVEALIQRACLEHDVSFTEVTSRCRYRRPTAARHQVWRDLKAMGWYSTEIAREFGVHHTTVMYATGTAKKSKRVRVAE
jgi:chromosomal replication initiation ATPase DnaA